MKIDIHEAYILYYTIFSEIYFCIFKTIKNLGISLNMTSNHVGISAMKKSFTLPS